MKKISFILMVFSISVYCNQIHAQKLFPENIYSFIENPELFEINQEPGHTPLAPYSTVADALKQNWALSKGYQSLDGQWKFNWAENPEKAPKDFFLPGFNDKNWANLSVPGNWEMAGFGDPVFRNVAQPFKSNPPYIPHDYNPVGSYRTSFNIPGNWKNQKVFLHMEASTSATFVWLNGKEVGYNQGANEPAEYDITPFLKTGKNILAVQVLKYSDGTYLEDQDFWRLAGIFRSVYLLSTPQVHLRDYFVTTDLDEKYQDAKLNIKAEIKNYQAVNIGDYKIRVSLFDENLKTIIEPIVSNPVSLSGNENLTIDLSTNVTNPKKWSAEFPNLYHLTLELLSPDGKVSEVISRKIGFKETEIKNQALWLNGVAIKLNGVNSHSQHTTLGHVMDTETIRRDFNLMKQFNINCVRTSHYPPVKEYLDLADEMGIYIIDETGDESHATEYISEKPEWRSAYVERVQKMVLRDRNYASVLFWSAGNESGFGNNICEVINEGKKLDPTRSWMYGGNSDDVAWKNEVPCEEIIGPRYPTPFQLETRIGQVPESQDPRPSFMDEYVAATGNGAGGLDEFWEVIYKYPRCIGGAIWDWVSPGIKEKIRLLKDESSNKINTSIKGRGKLTSGKFGKAVELNGHDQWIETYRDPALDIEGNELTISLWVLPRKWNGNGDFVTKGHYQFGLVQTDEKTLQFYLTGNKKVVLETQLPENWENNWHHLAAIYNGKEMRIYVDGKEAVHQLFTEKIKNKPFPVSLGYDAENDGQEYSNNLSNAIYDRAAIFSKAIAYDRLINADNALKNEAALWLEFDEETETGSYFSMGIGGRTYGLIWPDRSPQPELWQVKKSAQPVHTELVDAENGIIEVINRFGFTNLNTLDAVWELQKDDQVIQSGKMDISLEAGKTKQVKLPISKPVIEPGKEYRLLVSFRLKEDKTWATKGFEIAWDQLSLPYFMAAEEKSKTATEPLKMNETSDKLIISGSGFVYTFDKISGKLVSMNCFGKELINDGPKLNVWRAPLANETDNWTTHSSNLNFRNAGMGNGASNNWYSLGIDQLKYKRDSFEAARDANGNITVNISDHADGVDHNTGFSNNYAYEISPDGEIKIHHKVIPRGLMPAWLPKVGTQWSLKKELEQVKWYGRGPFENYPDRKSGAKIDIYNTTVEKMEEPYLKPQDYGCRTDNRWVEFETAEGIGLRFSGDELFNFSTQSYETDHLTRAQYPYQLKKADHIVFNFDYATSGVGCTAISVLNEYRVLPIVYNFTTTVKPYRK